MKISGLCDARSQFIVKKQDYLTSPYTAAQTFYTQSTLGTLPAYKALWSLRSIFTPVSLTDSRWPRGCSGRGHHTRFKDEETELENVSELPNVMQLASSGAGLSLRSLKNQNWFGNLGISKYVNETYSKSL